MNYPIHLQIEQRNKPKEQNNKKIPEIHVDHRQPNGVQETAP
jgi:hypothetical protein